MTGVDLDAVAEGREPLERFEEVAGAFACRHGEVGARRIADEQRVAGERDLLVDHERAVLRPVARRVQDTQPCLAHRQLLTVRERLERVRRVGDRVDRDRKTVLQGEPSVAGDVVGVRVRLEHAFDPQTLSCSGVDVLLDLEGRVDDHGHACVAVPDQIRGTAEILVDELPEEEHRRRA